MMDRGWTEGRTEGWRVAELLDPSRIPAGAETWFGKQVLFCVCVLEGSIRMDSKGPKTLIMRLMKNSFPRTW